MLKTKPIRATIEPSDGLRISVMSRHTLNDGVTEDPSIHRWMFDEHWPVLSPTDVGRWHRGEMAWDVFVENYRLRLKTHEPAASKVHKLIELAQAGNVTILCTEEMPANCHRKVLAEYCAELCPALDTSIE